MNFTLKKEALQLANQFVLFFYSDREDAKKMATDPMFKLEHGVKDQEKSKSVQPTLSQLQVNVYKIQYIIIQGPVQTSLHSCALPHWCKYGKRVVSENKINLALQFQFGFCKSVKFNRVCQTFVELNLGSTHGTPSESDVAPVLLQSRTYSVRFGTWKVRPLNQALFFLGFFYHWSTCPALQDFHLPGVSIPSASPSSGPLTKIQ